MWLSVWEWLGSRVVSMLDWGTEGPGFKSQSANSLRQTVLTHLASVHQAAKMVAALLRVAESNGSLPPDLWLASPAGWMPRTEISSGTLRSVIKYVLPLPSFICLMALSLNFLSVGLCLAFSCLWIWYTGWKAAVLRYQSSHCLLYLACLDSAFHWRLSELSLDTENQYETDLLIT